MIIYSRLYTSHNIDSRLLFHSWLASRLRFSLLFRLALHMLADGLHDLRVEQMLQRFFVRHVHRVFLFLGHGDLMKNNEAVDLTDLISRYGDDQKCRTYLEHLRWKDGI